MSDVYLGIDLGGTKMEAVLTDSMMRPLLRRRIPTEAEGGYEHIAGRIAGLVSMMSKESGVPLPRVIGIGAPGRYEPVSGRIRNSNTLSLNGRDLKCDLEKILGRDVVIENDANCFALAESMLGAGREIVRERGGTAFGMILGTGVGGGIVCGGRMLHGAHGIAGEWGHNELLPDGEPCYCGKRGCVETVISGPALERYYCSLTGSSRTLREIAGMADRDEAAEATLGRLTVQFSRALGPVLNILDPDCCIIGGGVGAIGRLYSQETVALIERYLFSARLMIPLLKPQLGDSAGVFGAALLTVKH